MNRHEMLPTDIDSFNCNHRNGKHLRWLKLKLGVGGIPVIS